MSAHHQNEFSWRGAEFLYKRKTPLWYTDVCTFFFAVFVALLFLHNFLGLVVLAVAFWFFLSQANHRPRTVDYTINPLGIHIEDRTIPYATLEAFSAEIIDSHAVITLDPIESFKFPTTLIAKPSDLDEIAELLSQHLPQHAKMPLLARITHRLHY